MRNLLVVCVLALLSLGCATKKYVGSEIRSAETRTQRQLDDLKQQVEETQTEIRNLAKDLDVKIEGLEQSNTDLTRVARDNAQVISQMGQLRFQKTLSESEANFRSDSAELTDTAKQELDKFAQLLTEQNKLVHLEIQGHTDNRGAADYNRKLGESRALAVREYLYREHDFPLHLMSIISLGEDDPIADNDTREGRAQNRRVVLVVRLQI